MKAIGSWLYSFICWNDTPEEGMKISALSSTEQAIIQCKQCRDQIKSYIKKMDKIAAAKREKAKLCLVSKDRSRAKIYLKQSKFHSEQSKVSLKQLEMIEEQISSIETNNQLLEINNVLFKGNDVLKKLHNEMNIEKWDKIADDMAESKAYQDEISNFFKQYHIDETEYNEGVNRDFDKLLNDLEGKKGVEFPNAHKGEIKINKEVIEEEEENNSKDIVLN